MPKGPRGEKRSADVVGNAVHVMRIATGEVEDIAESPQSAAAELGQKAGKARAKALSKERRRQIASAAAKKRGKKLEKSS